MPSGDVHARDTILVSIPLGISLGVAIGWSEGLLATAGCLLGLVASPDLDVDDGFRGFYVVRRYFGLFIAAIWQIFWWPYAKIIPHRSYLSHGIVVGTLLRTFYVYVPIAIVGYCFTQTVWIPPLWTAWLILGLIVSDSVHTVHDMISKGG